MRVFSILNRLKSIHYNTIIYMLESHGLEYSENLVGQSYVGASVMSSKHAGVQTQIKDVAKHAFYIHCCAHCLNLVLLLGLGLEFGTAVKALCIHVGVTFTKNGLLYKEKCLKVLLENFRD